MVRAEGQAVTEGHDDGNRGYGNALKIISEK